MSVQSPDRGYHIWQPPNRVLEIYTVEVLYIRSQVRCVVRVDGQSALAVDGVVLGESRSGA